MELRQTVQKKNTPTLVSFGITVCIGIFLNHSNVLFGINLSLADMLLIIFSLVWLINGEFDFPTIPLLFFVLFSIFLLIYSIFFIPYYQNFQINYRLVAVDYIKLFTIALYFLIGYLIEKKQLLNYVLYGFMFGAVLTSIIGIFLMFMPVPFLSESMYYAGVRLNGFMNDPNYFSVIQCAAIIVTLFLLPDKKLLKSLFLFILILSIFLSASKTGIITLLLSVLFYLTYFIKEGTLKIEKWLLLSAGLIIFVAISPLLLELAHTLITRISYHFPIFERVQILFFDFEKAAVDSGSGRGSVWETAFTITRSHPLFGVGIGNYSEIAYRISGDPNVAHNTYLQLSSEWGIPITFLLTSYIFYLVFSSIQFYKRKNRYIVKGILFIFLISSLSISFNNSRLFWFMVGIVTAQQSVEWLREKEKEND